MVSILTLSIVVVSLLITQTTAGETSGVVNNYYGCEAQVRLQTQGPPGKRGIAGPPGPPGPVAEIDYKLLQMKTSYPRTCNEIRGQSSGYYWISPNNDLLQPLHVFCEMKSGLRKTIINHNSMNELKVPKCKDPACYKHDIKYNGNLEQVTAVIDASKYCRQFIKYRCAGSVIFFYPNKLIYGYWLSRDGSKMLYWGGAKVRNERYCACGDTKTCIDPSKRCNCDQNKGVTSDEGFLSHKPHLPVTQLAFGDTDASSENGWHTLGRLECWD